jgi:hypothetical protein
MFGSTSKKTAVATLAPPKPPHDQCVSQHESSKYVDRHPPRSELKTKLLFEPDWFGFFEPKLRNPNHGQCPAR